MVRYKQVRDGRYHEERRKKMAPRYRLKRRTKVVLDAIRRYKGSYVSYLLDVGTADGFMLSSLCQELSISKSVGLDISIELLRIAAASKTQFVQADALWLPFKENIFDVLISASLIEHLPNVDKLLSEFNRVIEPGGLCIITTPPPFLTQIAIKIGYLENDICQTFSLNQLRSLFRRHSFEVVSASKFMLSPIGFPFEEKIERYMRLLGLHFFMVNQLIVGQKVSPPS